MKYIIMIFVVLFSISAFAEPFYGKVANRDFHLKSISKACQKLQSYYDCRVVFQDPPLAVVAQFLTEYPLGSTLDPYRVNMLYKNTQTGWAVRGQGVLKTTEHDPRGAFYIDGRYGVITGNWIQGFFN